MQPVAPALFSMSSTGTGVAAALAVAVQASNPELQSPVPVFQCGSGGCVSVPLALSTDRPVYLSLYGTGIRNRSSLGNVSVSIAGVNVPALYAGPASGFAGLDQVNVALPLSLQGAGESDVFIRVDGPGTCLSSRSAFTDRLRTNSAAGTLTGASRGRWSN